MNRERIDPVLVEKAREAALERWPIERVSREDLDNAVEAVIRVVVDELGLKEEFIVCGACGYPDPFSPTPNTLEGARRFQATCGGVINRRLRSAWAYVEVDA